MDSSLNRPVTRLALQRSGLSHHPGPRVSRLPLPHLRQPFAGRHGPRSRAPGALREIWRERRASNRKLDSSGVWRFREFLPETPEEAVVTLFEGNVPLIPGQKTAAYAGVERLWFKHLGWNPTGSFKDLGMTAAVTEARRQGAKTVACASTGNTAASMAAYAARG